MREGLRKTQPMTVKVGGELKVGGAKKTNYGEGRRG
jgi:hypothetical protein